MQWGIPVITKKVIMLMVGGNICSRKLELPFQLLQLWNSLDFYGKSRYKM